MTLGQTARNPLCIKGFDQWKGMIGIDARGHAIFLTIENGIRAAVRTLAQKARDGKTSIAAICGDWAPIDDTIGSIPGAPANSPTEYANYVSTVLEVRTETPLGIFGANGTIQDYERLVMLIVAMAQFENSHWSPRVSEILGGIAQYQADFVEAHA